MGLLSDAGFYVRLAVPGHAQHTPDGGRLWPGSMLLLRTGKL